LKLALGIDVETKNPAAANVDDTTGVSLDDANIILKMALGIEV